MKIILNQGCHRCLLFVWLFVVVPLSPIEAREGRAKQSKRSALQSRYFLSAVRGISKFVWVKSPWKRNDVANKHSLTIPTAILRHFSLTWPDPALARLSVTTFLNPPGPFYSTLPTMKTSAPLDSITNLGGSTIASPFHVKWNAIFMKQKQKTRPSRPMMRPWAY